MLSAISTYMPRWLIAIIATALVLAMMVGNRQDTASAIGPGDTNVAYVADGYNFPDALMGATLAALNTAPMLGVRGPSSGDFVPDRTATELDRLTNTKTNKLDTIYILGGPNAVSDNVAGDLEAWANSVERIFGNDRFGTMEAISQMLPAAVDEALHAQEADNADTLDGMDANAISRVAYDFRPGTALNGTNGTAASTEITAPTDGFLVLSGSLNLVNFNAADSVGCVLQIDGGDLATVDQSVDGAGNMPTVNMALDGARPVTAGSHTVTIYCFGVGSDTDVADPTLVVQFVPFGADGTQPTP